MYIQRKGAGMMGFGGAESCGPNQQWDPHYVYGNVTGQCTPLGTPMTKPPGGGSSWFDSLIKGAADVLKAKVTPGQTTIVQGGGSSGMSDLTKVALVGAGVVTLALIFKSRR